MATYITKTKIGKATFEGEAAYEFEKYHLTRYGLSVSRFEDDRRFSDHGPHFSISAVNTTLLRNMIFSHLRYALAIPSKFEFSGPVLGYARTYIGYSAAASGGDQRPITQLTMVGDLKQEGLSLDISGTAGHIFDEDCGSRREQFLTKHFSISLLIEPLYLPPIIDVRTGDNVFEKRFLGSDKATKIYPQVIEP